MWTVFYKVLYGSKELCKCKFVTVDTMKAYRESKHIPPLITNLKSR
jgi:hypothetical protein